MEVRLLQHNGKVLTTHTIPSFDRRPDVLMFGNRAFSFAHEQLVKTVKYYNYRECELFTIPNPDIE